MKNAFLFANIYKEDLKLPGKWSCQEKKGFWLLKGKKGSILLRRRDSYPKTFLIERGGSFLFGYGEQQVYNYLAQKFQGATKGSQLIKAGVKENKNEYLIIALIQAPSKIQIFRDAFCSMPLFYFKGSHGLAFSNRFKALLPFAQKEKELEIDFLGLTEYLLSLSGDPNRTVLERIKVLTERTILTYNGRSLKIKTPKPAPVLYKTRRLKEPVSAFENKLAKVLKTYWNKFPAGSKVGFEISGGLDSITAPGFYSPYTKNPLQAFSMLLPDKQGQSQKQKFQAIERKLNIKLHAVPVHRLFPLTSQVKLKRFRPFYPLREIYYEALKQEVRAARKKKIEIIFTGMGGDELFKTDPREPIGHQGKQEVEFRKQLKIPSFFTPYFKQKFLENLPHNINYPTPLIPYSVLGANLSRNNIFIENGIWPLSPLADPELVKFCRGLPKNWRENKKILKEHQRIMGYPKEIYDAKVNENFSNFFHSGLQTTHFQKLFQRLLKNSVLTQLNLIDKSRLKSEYSLYLRKKSEINENPLYFYTIAVVEIFFQSLRQNN
jgi:asparagine synthetase B (glutamine-hydrolysing)